jgi:pimeloyl-ACP methyl ester carboxylesterase
MDPKQYWKIVGGTTTDGIIVRAGREMQTKPAERRLKTGSIVLEKELVDHRLSYKLVSGEGPEQGWITIVSTQGKELAQVSEKPLGTEVGSKAKLLRDPSWLGELETHEMTIGHLKAIVTRRPEGEPKAPLAVVMLPGNPIVNSYTCSMDLPVAVHQSFAAAGFPVVRFDWDGVGMNKPGNHPPTQEYEATWPDSWVMYEHAIQNLGEKIVLCSWNFSGTTASKILLQKSEWPGVCALVSLSFAYKQWEFVARFVSEDAGQGLKADFEEHSLLEVPAIYVFGSKDVHTPEEVVRELVGKRPDGGTGAAIHVVDQSDQKLVSTEYFMMKGKEEEVGLVSATWLSDLRDAMRVAESPHLGA